MKVEVKRQKDYGEPKVVIHCDLEDSTIPQLVDLIQETSVDFNGKKEDRNFIFKAKEVYYIESMDDQCFLYTKDDVFDCKYKLYEVENKYSSFIRVNKNVVVNYKKIKFFKSSLNGRLDATLNNGDRVEISRTYVQALKTLLGGQKQ